MMTLKEFEHAMLGRFLQLRRGKSITQVAKETGISAQTLYAWHRGEVETSARILRKIEAWCQEEETKPFEPPKRIKRTRREIDVIE